MLSIIDAQNGVICLVTVQKLEVLIILFGSV